MRSIVPWVAAALALVPLATGDPPQARAAPEAPERADGGDSSEEEAERADETDASDDPGDDAYRPPEGTSESGEGDEHDADHGHGGDHGPRGHRFEDAERWAEKFNDPERDAWQKPELVVERLALEPDETVGIIGSATGYFAYRIAPEVPKGRVWGVDVEPTMVRYLNEQARRRELDNLFSILGRPDDPLLPEPVDVVLMVNTYHHLPDPVAYWKTVSDDLAPDARVVIVDFEKGDLPVGPPDEMKLTPEEMREHFQRAGYEQTARETEALPHQYLLVFERDGDGS